MTKEEAKFQGQWTKACKTMAFKSFMRERGWCAFGLELKYTKGDRIAFSAIKYHQILEAGRVAGEEGERPFVFKIPDIGAQYRPLDFVVMSGAEGGLLLGYGKRSFYVPHHVAESKMFKVDGGRKRGSFTLKWCEENAEEFFLADFKD